MNHPDLCPGVSDVGCNSVNYTNRRICAFTGSSVDISCLYTTSRWTTVSSVSWFTSQHLKDLTTDPKYKGRAEVIPAPGSSTLRILNLTKSDAAEYRFRFNRKHSSWTSRFPGTTLNVTGTEEL